MPTAHEREAAIAPSMEKARHQVSELQQAIKAAEASAHAAYTRADVAGGDGDIAEAADLRRELESAQARLSAFEEAAHDVAAERQRERQAADLERVTAAVTTAADEMTRQLAEVGPALSAAKLALRLSRQAGDLANRLDQDRHVLECELTGAGHEAGGVRYLPQRVTRFGQVQAALERSPLLRALLADGAY